MGKSQYSNLKSDLNIQINHYSNQLAVKE